VQNAVLAAVLDGAGVDSCLVIGLVGRGGHAEPGLHAWVEARSEEGRWWVADASAVVVDGDSGAVVEWTHEQEPQREVGDPATDWWRTMFEAREVIWLVVAAVLVILSVVLVVCRLRGVRRRIRLGEGVELAALLEGAIRRPEAFGDVRAIEARPLVPLVGGGSMSLSRARSLAAARRLYRSTADGPNPSKNRRWAVVDATKAEGRVVADLLGAVDVDRWRDLLDRSRETTVTQAVCEAVQAIGERWRLRAVSGMTEPLATVETGVLTGSAGKVVLVADDGRMFEAAERLHGAAPACAVLLLADAVLNHLPMQVGRRAKILAALARVAGSEGVDDGLG